ncbi:class I SAM-dependent methyltransferase [Flindersiella endophytica]
MSGDDDDQVLVPSQPATSWPDYLERFHAGRPGRVEQAMERLVADGLTPYAWVNRPVAGRARRVLDLGCGSGGAAARLLADETRAGQERSIVIGLDRSAAELELARDEHELPVVHADAVGLPFRDGCFDAVVCSMGLMVAQPLTDVLAESARVLRSGGVLSATVASSRPLRPSDLLTLGPLTAKLRSTPRFPSGGELGGVQQALESSGFLVLEDARERFEFRVRGTADARLLLESLYLPDVPASRLEQAIAWLTERAQAGRDGIVVATPIRRILAMRH